MHLKKIFFLISLLLILSGNIFAQERPSIIATDLIIAAERDFNIEQQARSLALDLELPYSIYSPEGIFITAMGIENNEPVYVVMKDITNPLESSYTAFYHQIESIFNLEKARVHYGAGRVTNPELGYSDMSQRVPSEDVVFLLAMESTNDACVKINAFDGSLIDPSFIVDPTNFSTPIQARLAPFNNYTISGQLADAVFNYDTSGTLLSLFAPAGGVNSNIMDNVRGHNYKPDGNLVVTVGSGPNADAIAEFDQSGNYVGNFIAPNSTIMDSPFDIIFRTNDVLVAAITTDAVHRYDLNGTYLDNLVPSINFPEQIAEFSSGDIGVAGFSLPSGVYIYGSDGTFKLLLNVVTGVRGVTQLGNGNIITTNGGGIFVIDATTGAIINTVVAGVSGRFVSQVDFDIVPVELTSFSAKANGSSIQLNWSTATETNNAGFDIERKSANSEFSKIAHIDGNGTTTNISEYSFKDSDVQNQTYYYRLKQIDYDGSFEYSNVVEVNFEIPNEFKLAQNYPNPFNPTTTIEFSLPVDSKVSVSIYNLIGQRITTVTNSNFEAGINRVEFNASKLVSGLYLYMISAQGSDGQSYQSTKKMMLMK